MWNHGITIRAKSVTVNVAEQNEIQIEGLEVSGNSYNVIDVLRALGMTGAVVEDAIEVVRPQP